MYTQTIQIVHLIVIVMAFVTLYVIHIKLSKGYKMQIYKLEIPMKDRFNLIIHKNSVILESSVEKDKPYLYCLSNKKELQQQRSFAITKVNEPINFVGTYMGNIKINEETLFLWEVNK